MYSLRFTHLLVIAYLSIVCAKPQYDSLNSPPKTSDKLVRVEGDVHPEKAEENKLPGGLNPPSKNVNDGSTHNASKSSEAPSKSASKSVDSISSSTSNPTNSEPSSYETGDASQAPNDTTTGPILEEKTTNSADQTSSSTNDTDLSPIQQSTPTAGSESYESNEKSIDDGVNSTTAPFTSESPVFENTQESITSHSTSNEIASSTPGASYESENESSTASPAAPSATFDYVTEISTSPPSEEPSSPGHDIATPDNQTTSVFSEQEATSTNEPEYSSAESNATTPASESVWSIAQNGGSQVATTEASTDQTTQSSAPKGSGYDDDSATSSVLSESTSPSASQPIPEKTGDSLPPKIEQSSKKSASNRPRAWKISQGKETKRVDGSTGDSDNSEKSQSPASVDEEKSKNKVQASGYGENEMSSPPQKANVVSPKDAVGYDGIVDSPPAMAQRDMVAKHVEVAVNKTVKQAAPIKRKWKKYIFDCATETDDKDELLCQEWAKGGLCESHKPTMFLFCRRTCLCVGPPDDNIKFNTKRQRKRRNQRARL